MYPLRREGRKNADVKKEDIYDGEGQKNEIESTKTMTTTRTAAPCVADIGQGGIDSTVNCGVSEIPYRGLLYFESQSPLSFKLDGQTTGKL